MKILAYLAFTLLSVLIQFCVIDYIQAQLEDDALLLKPKIKDLNVTSKKKTFVDIIKEYGVEPHALYYRTDNAKLQEKALNLTIPVYSNETLAESFTTTEKTSSVYDIMYEENATSISEIFTTTDLPFVTTEFENVTDLTLFNTNNATNIKPTPSSKKTYVESCYCNLLYQLCDINCCCDGDCTDKERILFNCTEKGNDRPEEAYSCSALASSTMISGIENLFCVVKTNLPEKRNTMHKKYKTMDIFKVIDGAMNWQDRTVLEMPVLTPKLYSHGEPIWILRNDTVSYIDLPFSKINSNCDSRAPIYFMIDQHVQCNVAARDLEMFNIVKNIEETKVISVKTMNTSNTNCSQLHCTDWKIKVCNETTCTSYTKEMHEPYCTDNINLICKNIAVKVDYVFYYWDSKIVDALLYFHVPTVFPTVQYIRQEISVKFYFTEDSAKRVVSLSGNPGYLKGRPLIVSFESDNYTRSFFNNGSLHNLLNYPYNKNGVCMLTNITNFVNFGSNRRNKCLYKIEPKMFENATESCERINKDIKNILGLDRKIVISPLGNPHGLNDDEWISLNMDKSHEMIGAIHGMGELHCQHIVTKISLRFGFADVSDIVGKEKFKILTSFAHVKTQNYTFTEEDQTVILTYETNFVDVTKPTTYEYAGSPQLNIHLPKDFFFPFPSNKCNKVYETNVAILTIYSYLVITFIPK